MKILVVNLERSADRREFMEQNLGQLGIEFKFFRAIDAHRGEHVPLSRYSERKALAEFGRPLSIGEVGCFASHYLLWQRCIVEREPLVILEDDVLIDDQFPRALAAVRELIGRLRLIRLGLGFFCDQYSPAGSCQGFDVVEYMRDKTLGTQGYAVSPEGAANLVAHAHAWFRSVDCYLRHAELHGVDSYGLLPLPVTHADQRAYPSVIGEERYARRRMKTQITQFLAIRKTLRNAS